LGDDAPSVSADGPTPGSLRARIVEALALGVAERDDIARQTMAKDNGISRPSIVDALGREGRVRNLTYPLWRSVPTPPGVEPAPRTGYFELTQFGAAVAAALYPRLRSRKRQRLQ
jgi:hypothetical protein